jgi:hypothetical protein
VIVFIYYLLVIFYRDAARRPIFAVCKVFGNAAATRSPAPRKMHPGGTTKKATAHAEPLPSVCLTSMV